MATPKHLPLRIIHLIFVVAGIVLYAVTLISFAHGASALNILSTVLNIAALAASIVYLVSGYTKEANLSYKIFMWLFIIAEIIECTSVFSMGVAMSAFSVFRKVFTLAVVVLLGGAKDYGRKKSNIVSIALVVLNAYSAIAAIPAMSRFAEAGLSDKAMLLDAIGQLILASTAALMVCGKYLDKIGRGAK